MRRLLSPRGTGTSLRRGRIPPDVLFGKNERTMDEKNPCPVDWRLFRPASQYSQYYSLSRGAQRQRIGTYLIYLTLPFLDLSDEPSPPPSPSLLSSAVAASAMLSYVFPSMMDDGGGAWTGGGRQGCWCHRNQRRMAKKGFFLSA